MNNSESTDRLFDIPGSETISGGFWNHVKMLIPGILIMVAFYTIFASVFFFTYGAYIEKLVVKNNSKLLVDGLVDDISSFGKEYDKTYMESIKKSLQKIKMADMTQADEKVTKNNRKIMKKTALVIGIGSVVLSIFAIIFWKFISKRTWKDFNTHIIFKSLLLLLIVAIAETLYFTSISKNYRAVDPNVAKKALIDSISTEIKKKKDPTE